MRIKAYTILTCPTCAAYIDMLRQFCIDYNYSLEVYDIDSDPILSVQYLREYRHCSTSVPFFAIYDEDDTRINCFSGILEKDDLERILLKYGF